MNRQSILRQVNSSREMQGELRKILNENSQDILLSEKSRSEESRNVK